MISKKDKIIISIASAIVIFISALFIVWVIDTDDYEPIEVHAATMDETITPKVEPIVIDIEIPEEISSAEQHKEYSEVANETETETEAETETETEKPKELWYEVGTFHITHYCSCKKCCGKWGTITRTGTTPTRFRTIAVDPKVIPLGSKVYIEGYGYRIAEDTGSAIKGKHIDVYTGSDHNYALSCGTPDKKVWIIKEAKNG